MATFGVICLYAGSFLLLWIGLYWLILFGADNPKYTFNDYLRKNASFSRFDYMEELPSKVRTRVRKTSAAIAVVLSLVVTNFTVWQISSHSDGDRYANIAQTMHHAFGFDANMPYAINLGETFVGVSGSSYVNKGFFSVQSGSSFKTDKIVSIDYEWQGKRWMVPVPTDRVTFIIDDAIKEPTMSVQLDDDRINYTNDSGNLDDAHAIMVRTYGECRMSIERLLATECQREQLSEEFVPGRGAHLNFNDYLNAEYIYVEGFEITLTQSQYNAILGGASE